MQNFKVTPNFIISETSITASFALLEREGVTKMGGFQQYNAVSQNC